MEIKYLFLCTSVLLLLSTYSSAQTGESQYVEAQPKSKSIQKIEPEKNGAINFGLLMGGGSLLGVDIEKLIAPAVGLQFGVGLGSVGGGINFHFKQRVNSPFMSIQYMHQGFGDNHYASYLGPMFVFRARKIFQAGLGFGYVLTEGPTSKLDGVPVVLLYNIGLYFPL